MKTQEGFIQTKGGKVWYEIVGNKNTIPLIALHGGPGYPHDSLESLKDLSNEQKVIFYDQLGCGNSQRVKDKSLWTVKYFVAELQEIVKKLNLKHYHILGHSWGAALGVAFALTKPKGLKSLILSSPYISTPHWEKDAQKLLAKLPKNMRGALKGGKIKSKGYQKASKVFYERYVFRTDTDKRPTAAIRAGHKMSHEIYEYMWGPEEFIVKGTLKNLDLSKRLAEIKVPTLLLCGRFDEATPQSTEYFKSLMPNAQMKVFEKSAHMPHWTERREYINTIRSFLRSL